MEDCPAFCCSFQQKNSATEDKAKDGDGNGGEPSCEGNMQAEERDASMAAAEQSAFEDQDEEMKTHEKASEQVSPAM